MNKDLIFVPVVCFKGQYSEKVESAEGCEYREKIVHYFYTSIGDAEDALEELLKYYREHGCTGKIITYKRVIEDAK